MIRAQDDYTVSEVASLSRESASTISRRIGTGSGDLHKVPGTSNPVRLTADSVHAYLRRLIGEGPALPVGVPRFTDPGERDERDRIELGLRSRIEELERAVREANDKVRDLQTENEALRNDVHSLKAAHELVLDRLGARTAPRFPNN